MSIATLILGESGTGKSASMRNIDPSKACLIQVIQKPLPFKSAGWIRYEKGKGGNVFVSDSYSYILDVMEKTQKEIIIIDDFQYLMANEFMRRADERGFDKFSEIARHAWDVLTLASNLSENKRVYILGHTQTDEYGHTKAKTIGKLLDDKINLEGMFSIVLRTRVTNGEYRFITQNNGQDTTKSPIGLFEGLEIDNDMNAVDQEICKYYQIGAEPNV